MNKSFQNYYTRTAALKEYMLNMLNLSNDDKVLEPCGGNGSFIDAILEKNPHQDIDTIDINKKDVETLKNKYTGFPNVSVRYGDTLLDNTFELDANIGGVYDRIIGNPPYGAWFDYEYRRKLKNVYGELYVKESYLLFLIRSISLLKDHGKLVFIIPDTYLYLNSYKKIRMFILKHTKIQEIIKFPSSFFEGISFQYSNLSIVTLEKEDNLAKAQANNFQVLDGFHSNSEIGNQLDRESLNKVTYKQSEVLKTTSAAIMPSKALYNLSNKANFLLGDMASCVTGIYTGDNKKYIAALIDSKDQSQTRRYNKVSSDEVSHTYSITGTEDNKSFVPLVKGSTRTRFIRENKWVIKWDKKSVNDYNTKKKARFQNSQFYFQKGIAVPMLKSSKLRSTIMENQVFDQSIVGIFLKEGFDQYFDYILAFMNSEVANRLIHIINPTVNNSANYLKKIPIIIPEKDMYSKICNLAQQLIRNPSNDEKLTKLNQYFDVVYAKSKALTKITS